MKNIQDLELNQYINKRIEDKFVSLFINKDVYEIINLLNPFGTFCNLDQTRFIDKLIEILIVFNYKIVSYDKNYSNRLKVSEVVHSFKLAIFDRDNDPIETITMNLLLKFSSNKIHSIYTENDVITKEEFEVRQFNN
jgi:hypothetical protein